MPDSDGLFLFFVIIRVKKCSDLVIRRAQLAYEGFYEDLARQNTVARLFQLQLGFRRRYTWVSVSSHMGFSHRRGVLKATI